ncbi:MAG TPA: DUF4012 domain-containing protein [Ktedonobacterales bacterium]|nr:DUF4012 domain-containing protein [Ktedonobacterales bacterium]
MVFIERFSGWHRSKVRRRLVYLALALLMLASIVTPLALTGASTLQVYEHIRQLGTAGVAPLLKVKDLFVKSSPNKPGAASSSCSAAPTPSATRGPRSTATPAPSPTAPTPTPTPGAGSGLPLPVSGSSLNSVDFKALTSPARLNQAYGYFATSRADFVQLSTELDSHPMLFQLAGMVPSYAKQIKEVKNIADVGIDIGTLGEEVTTTALALVQQLPTNPLASGNSPLITADQLPLIEETVNDATNLLSDIQTRLAQVNLKDLPVSACQRSSFTKAIAFLPEAQKLLNQAGTLLPVGIWMLGIDQPRTFLVQTLDRAELRPGGGFAGQYGTVTINGGRIGSLSLQDIAWLDYCGTGTCYALGNHAPAKWSWWPFGNFGLRDSNDSGDFPTDAHEAINLFAQEGGGQVDGVIDMTPLPIEHILEITGPIYIPDYNETITAQNLEDRIHYYQQNPAGIAKEKVISASDTSITARKRFTSLVGRILQDKVRHLPLNQLEQVIKQVLTDMRSKDIEIYLASPAAEALLTKYGMDSAMYRSSSGPDDTWMVVQANISVSKATQYVHTTERDDVQLDADGGATHHLTISLWYNKQGNVYGPSTYTDYIRVYARAGSQLLSASGFASGWPNNTSSDESGLAMWGGLLKMQPFQTRTITLTWYTPHVATTAKTAVAGQSPYTLLVQRQSGTLNALQVAVTPASGAASTQGTQPVSYSGTQDTNQVVALPPLACGQAAQCAPTKP